MSPTSLYTPSKRGISIRSRAPKNILNVYSRLREENPQESISEIVRKVSGLTGISKITVFRLKKEKTLSALSSPGKKRPSAVGQRRRLVKYDDFTLSCIRRKIHGFFRNEIPTLSKVLKEINDDAKIFSKNISQSTLYRLLKDVGFTFEKRKTGCAS
ncbi:DDE_3 domain-containing protein [Trichonephila inaurata madagascariensis]|uniref:DDE_3 domain-containing protein n=1 Tax=Trichonephila inaurata madagascariensis TaxID=2747483 RepID=A0A8X6Y1F5_9ARAC|nr:DDE_3 domain-containing protein [Trichonephila inaurata madagascariensis]